MDKHTNVAPWFRISIQFYDDKFMQQIKPPFY